MPLHLNVGLCLKQSKVHPAIAGKEREASATRLVHEDCAASGPNKNLANVPVQQRLVLNAILPAPPALLRVRPDYAGVSVVQEPRVLSGLQASERRK